MYHCCAHAILICLYWLVFWYIGISHSITSKTKCSFEFGTICFKQRGMYCCRKWIINRYGLYFYENITELPNQFDWKSNTRLFRLSKFMFSFHMRRAPTILFSSLCVSLMTSALTQRWFHFNHYQFIPSSNDDKDKIDYCDNQKRKYKRH